jgi:hypothetical protein
MDVPLRAINPDFRGREINQSSYGCQQFPALGFLLEKSLFLISNFANRSATILTRTSHLTTCDGVARDGSGFR